MQGRLWQNVDPKKQTSVPDSGVVEQNRCPLKDSLREKLDQIVDRYEEVTHLLSDQAVMADSDRFRALSIEHSELSEYSHAWSQFGDLEAELEATNELLSDPDLGEMKQMALDESQALKEQIEKLEESLKLMMLPKDPNDKVAAFLEVRAGTGGDEAAIFAGDLFRMYSRFAEAQGWQIEVLSASEGEHGGFKEVISRVSGSGVYGRLKFESGAHRVQRVPQTESQGRVHTSACTVAVMPEVEIDDTVDIKSGDLRVDTFRASGAGGQHVNKTDSAIRITHLPTGTVVECQQERSQHANRDKAMKMLASKLVNAKVQAQVDAASEMRRDLVGGGDRSERIRTYNFPQGRLTDHRINLTLYKLDSIIEGDLGELLDALSREHQADLMSGAES